MTTSASLSLFITTSWSTAFGRGLPLVHVGSYKIGPKFEPLKRLEKVLLLKKFDEKNMWRGIRSPWWKRAQRLYRQSPNLWVSESPFWVFGHWRCASFCHGQQQQIPVGRGKVSVSRQSLDVFRSAEILSPAFVKQPTSAHCLTSRHFLGLPPLFARPQPPSSIRHPICILLNFWNHSLIFNKF